MKYAVFTVMTPEWDLQEVVGNLARLGYDGVEWRVQKVPGEIEEGPLASQYRHNKATVDLKHVLELAPELKSISRDAGLEICSLTSHLHVDQTEEVERVMQAAQIMGCPRIRVRALHYDRARNYHDLFAETTEHLREVETLAREYSIEANLEIHMGNIMPSAGLAHRLVSQFDPELIGVIYDPGNMVHEGYENWRMGLELLGPYVHHVHVKNAVWEQGEELEDGTVLYRCKFASVPKGVANWHEIMADLKAVGYDGWLSFEDFSSVASTREKCRTNLAYLKALEQTRSIPPQPILLLSGCLPKIFYWGKIGLSNHTPDYLATMCRPMPLVNLDLVWQLVRGIR